MPLSGSWIKLKSTVLVQAYSFTSYRIAKVPGGRPKERGKVEIILDKSHRTEQYSSATFLLTVGSGEHRRRSCDRPQQGHGR